MKSETYCRISNMLVYRLRRRDSTDEVGLRKSDLINWYLESIEEDMQSEEDLNANRRQVRAVIERLVRKDCVLIELTEGDKSNPILVVHPNYEPSQN